MAGSIIAMPSNGDSDWSNFVTIVEKTYRGYIGISISNPDSTSEPKIEDGSVIEVNGSVFQFTTAETLTGWPSAGGTILYMTVVPAGTVMTAVFTASAPTWSGTKNGWYDGNDRYFGQLTWGGSATYSTKIIYKTVNDGFGEPGTLIPKTKVVELGDWDMNGTVSTLVAHGVPSANSIVYVTVSIRKDGDAFRYPLNLERSSDTESNGSIFWTDTSVTATRRIGGFFDDTDFDATSFNRGWIVVTYI